MERRCRYYREGCMNSYALHQGWMESCEKTESSKRDCSDFKEIAKYSDEYFIESKLWGLDDERVDQILKIIRG